MSDEKSVRDLSHFQLTRNGGHLAIDDFLRVARLAFFQRLTNTCHHLHTRSQRMRHLLANELWGKREAGLETKVLPDVYFSYSRRTTDLIRLVENVAAFRVAKNDPGHANVLGHGGAGWIKQKI